MQQVPLFLPLSLSLSLSLSPCLSISVSVCLPLCLSLIHTRTLAACLMRCGREPRDASVAGFRGEEFARCRANMAHITQSRPDSGRGLQVNVAETVESVPSSLGSGQAHNLSPRGSVRSATRPRTLPRRPRWRASAQPSPYKTVKARSWTNKTVKPRFWTNKTVKPRFWTHKTVKPRFWPWRPGRHRWFR